MTIITPLVHLVFNVFLLHFPQAPNFEVRANATLLFTEAFPIHDPDQTNKDIDETIQKQLDTVMVRTFQTLTSLLSLG